MTKIDQAWLQAEYDKILVEYYDDTKKAPMRSKYNRLTGSYASTKNDVTKAVIANVKVLNMIAESKGLNAVHDFEEEQATLPGKAK